MDLKRTVTYELPQAEAVVSVFEQQWTDEK